MSNYQILIIISQENKILSNILDAKHSRFLIEENFYLD